MTNSKLWTNKATWLISIWLEKTQLMHDELMQEARERAFNVKSFAEYLHDYVEEARPEYKVGYEGWGIYQEIMTHALKEIINWEEIANYYFELVELEELAE